MMEPPISVGPLVFEEFFAQLRRQGLTIGVDHHLRLQELLSKIGSECAPGDLKTILCPIFATDANQQKLFYRAFDSYFAVFSRLAASDAFTTSPATQAKEKATGERKTKTGRRRWPYFALGGTLAAGLFIVAILMLRKPAAPTPPTPAVPSAPAPEAASTPAPTPPAPQTPAPETQTVQTEGWLVRHRESLRLGAVIVVPLLLFLFYEWYRLIRRRLVLQRKRGKRPPFSWPIHPESSPSAIYDSAEFYGAARRLQRRQVGGSYHLDIEASVQATVDSLGFPRLQYKPDRKLPEYLVLVDRASFRDHQANLFHDLIRALRDEGLYVSLFFFEGDPRVAWDEERGDTVPLYELQRRYAGHRLLLLSDGEKLTDALSGSLAAWSSLLLEWKDRGVLTPEPLAHWGLREKALASQFIVLPATTEGLFALGDYFELPSQPDTSAIERTSPDQAPPVPDDPRGMEALRSYLGDGTFLWLAACAVYPELHWDLTLHLGSLPCFGPGLVTEQNLLKLVRLPWFRRGSIPDELRLPLIRELGEERERAVREAIVDLLEKNPAPNETFASDARHLEILFQRHWLDRQSSKKRGELIRALRAMPEDDLAQNYTMLRSVESVSKSRLDVALPARLRRMLFPSGLSAFGLRTSVRFAATLALIAAGTVVLTPRGVVVWRWIIQPPTPPPAAEVELKTSPPGATLLVDGKEVGASPHRVTLPDGYYKIEARKEGFKSSLGLLTVKNGSSNLFNPALEPIAVMLRISTDLQAPQISLDGQPAGEIKDGVFTLESLEMGKHTVRVFERHTEAAIAFEAKPGAMPALTEDIQFHDLKVVTVSTIGSHGRVQFTFNPGPVAVDGVQKGEVGSGALELNDLSRGTHRLDWGEGADQGTLQFELGDNPAMMVDLISDRPVGNLLVSADQDDAEVFVDGTDKGRTKNGGLRVSNLTAKQHVVTLVKDGYHSEPDARTVNVVKGSEITAELRLLANAPSETEPSPRDVLTKQAIEAFNNQHYVLPEGQNAVYYLKQLRELDPNYAWAKQELELSIQGAVHEADVAIKQQDFTRAKEIADASVQLLPDRKEGKSLLEDLRYRERQYEDESRATLAAPPLAFSIRVRHKQGRKNYSEGILKVSNHTLTFHAESASKGNLDRLEIPCSALREIKPQDGGFELEVAGKKWQFEPTNPSEFSFAALKSACGAADSRLLATAPPGPQPSHRPSEESARATEGFVVADMDRAAAGEVNGQLRAFCGRLRPTLSKYPFQPSSQEDTSLDELTRWFAPQSGEIWKFQAQALEKLTEKHGSRWTEKDPASKPQVTGEVLNFLNSAQAVANAFFPAGATQPHLTFVLRPRLDSAFGDSILELEIDGKSYPWTTKVQKQFTWPPPAGSQSLGATVWIKDGPLKLNIASRPGIWGIFRIIGDAEPRALNGKIVEWEYASGERGLRQAIHPAPVRLEIIEFPGGADVFSPQFYEGLKCPARAVQ